MRILITAGPTREYIDPVRFISNASTGKMGYGCAIAAARRGHEVILISGPVALARPRGVKFISVVGSGQMSRAVNQYYPNCDCVIMTAAVCDYRPMRYRPCKIVKSKRDMVVKLRSTDDILAGLGSNKGDKILIGFAVQDRSARQSARCKMKAKNLDAIILNGPAAFGADKSDVQILKRGGKWQVFDNISKTQLATIIVALAQELADGGV